MNESHAYCASDGGSPFGLIAAVLGHRKSLPTWPQLDRATVICTYLGRTSLWQLCHIWGLKAGDEILMPAFNCGTEIDPFIRAGARPILYRVDHSAQIDNNDIRRRVTPRTRILYVTHYFGWPQPVSELKKWCHERNILLVEDCALALFSTGVEGPLGTLGDAAIFSLRKFLPFPDGSILTLQASVSPPHLKGPPLMRTGQNLLPLLKRQVLQTMETLRVYSSLRGFMLKRQPSQIRPPHPGHPDMPTDYYLQDEIRDKSISRLSRNMLQVTNAPSIIFRRRANYLRLSELLRDIPEVRTLYNNLPEGVTPMVLPLFAPCRSEFVRRLNSHGIAAFPFWEGYHRDLDWREYPEARYLKDNMLTLPVHQRLGHRHMAYMASVVRKLAKEFVTAKGTKFEVHTFS